MKLVVDVEKLVAAGTITPEQAKDIRRIAAADTSALAINTIAVLGAFAVVLGFFLLYPPPGVIALLGLGLTGTGLAMRMSRPNELGFVGALITVIGALMVAGGLLLNCSTPIGPRSGFQFLCPASEKSLGFTVLFLAVTVWLAAVGWVARNSLLVALSVFALAGALGSSTGYWHASYALLVREATVTIVVFGLIAIAAAWAGFRLAGDAQRLVRLLALMALLWANFGFWIGSLWGDRPGETWAVPEVFSHRYSEETWRALKAWQEQAFFIPRLWFVVGWALALVGVAWWAAHHNRRGALNMCITFGVIHLYTQWFERLQATTLSVLGGGLLAVVIAVALWHYRGTVAGEPARRA